MTSGAGRGTDFLQLDPAGAPRRRLTGWLVDQLRNGITDGRVPVGTMLPPSRQLADDLSISRGVVVGAYQQLADEGLVEGRTGAGSWVLGRPGLPPDAGDGAGQAVPGARPAGSGGVLLPARTGADPRPYDLTPGVPDLSYFPRAAWLRAERAVLNGTRAAELGYGDPAGHPQLRAALAPWLRRTRGLLVEPSDIIVVAGVAQALALLAQVLTARGHRTIMVEDPGSRGARDEVRHWGLQPLPVPVDGEGLQTEPLGDGAASVVMVTPAHQFPTGVVLSAARRRALLQWANQGGLVIEDDYDAEFRYDRAPVPALQASAPDRVAHAGSTSKALAPGLRLGWLVAPTHLRTELVTAKHASDLGTPAIPQLVLTHLLLEGDYDRHLRAVRQRQRRRRDALLDGLRAVAPGLRVGGAPAGLHLTIDLAADLSDTDVVTRLAALGVVAQPLSWHRMSPGPPGVVVGYAAQPPERLREAGRLIARTVAGPTAS